MASRASAVRSIMVPEPAVPRGTPLLFRWLDETLPDSLEVTFVAADTTLVRWLKFDAGGSAAVSLPAATYRWMAAGLQGARGTVAVESYSDELLPRGAVAAAGAGAAAFRLEARYARGRWWLFVVAVAAFVAEWAWRQRQGLP
jgi:hypothetical protein